MLSDMVTLYRPFSLLIQYRLVSGGLAFKSNLEMSLIIVTAASLVSTMIHIYP